MAPRDIGDLATMMALRRNPIELWGEHAYREGVVEGRFLSREQFLVNDPEAIHRVLMSNIGNYVRDTPSARMLRPAFGGGLLTAEGESWRLQRRMIAPAMTPRALTSLAHHVAAESAGTEAELDAFEGGPVELLPVMQHLALGIAARSMFSLEMTRHDQTLRKFVEDWERGGLAQLVVADLLNREEDEDTPVGRKRTAFRNDWVRFIDEVLAERFAMERPEGAPRDLLDMLSDARDAETGAALDPDLLRDDVASMILAGHETTAVTLFWSCFLLARFPEWQEELAAEAGPIDLAPEAAAAAIPSLVRIRSHVDETLRLYPPVYAITREAVGDDELGGVPIAAGSLVTVAPFVIHRHESHWQHPGRFDPGRFAANPPARYTYLPFGAGPRVCIGATFALTEVVVVLARLLQRFRVELAPGHWDVLPRGLVTTYPDRKVSFLFHRRETAR